MNLLIGAWYNEPGISFHFSYKVDNYIRERIKDHIMLPLGLLDIDKDIFINITIATKADQGELEVRFGRLSKRSPYFHIGFWFPFKPIINSDNPLEKYLDNYVKATKILFDKWNVTDEQISNLRQDVFKEILNNIEYEGSIDP